MAVYYVATNGNDSAAGSSAAPFATIGRANNRASQGDTIRVRAGTYPEKGVIHVKTNVTYISEVKHGAIIDCKPNNLNGGFRAEYGSFAATNAHHVVIDGFWIRDAASGGIGMNRTYMITVQNCRVSGSVQNGIGSANCDLLNFRDNEVHNNTYNEPARSGISILTAIKNTYGAGIPSDWGGYRLRVTGNRCWRNGRWGQNDADGNGIILDKLHYKNSFFGGSEAKSLVSGNYCYLNGGCGIKIMASEYVTVEYNTCVHNKQNIIAGMDKAVWRGELEYMYVSNCIMRYNIAMSNNDYGGVITNCTSKNFKYETDFNMPHNVGNVWTSNIGFTTAGKVNWTSGAGVAITGTINKNPRLKSPPTGTARAADDAFALLAGSPAIGAAPGGRNIGAYQDTAVVPEPSPDIAINSAPVIAMASTVGGTAFTLTNGTYSETPTSLTRVAQLRINGTWTDQAASVLSSLTSPVVTTATAFSVLERYAGTGVSSGENRSNIINLQPKVTQVEPGDTTRKTPVYVGGSFKSAALDSGMTIPQTYQEGDELVAIDQVTAGTARVPPAPWEVILKIDGSSVGDTCSTTIARIKVTAGQASAKNIVWGTWTGVSTAGHKSVWQFRDAEIDMNGVNPIAAVKSSLSGTGIDWPALPTAMTAGSLVIYSIYSNLQHNPFSFPPSSDFTERMARTSAGTGIGSGSSGDSGTTRLSGFPGGGSGALGTSAQLTYGLLSIRGVLLSSEPEPADPDLAAVAARVSDLEILTDGLDERLQESENRNAELEAAVVEATSALAEALQGLSDVSEAVSQMASSGKLRLFKRETE